MSESQPLPTGNACPNFLQTTFTPLYMQSPPVESLFKQSGDESRPTRQTVELPRQTVDLPNRETGRSLAINNIGMAVFSSMTGNAGLQNLGRGESSALRGFNSGIGIDSAGMFVKGNNVNPFLQKSPESKNKSSLFDVSSSSSHVPMQRARSKKNEPRITGP